MRAEVVGVGTELLLGQIPNGNAREIAEALARIGVDCVRHTAVGDNVERIAAALAEALERADAVIVTGGLGPTQDDVTREAVAVLTGVALRRDESLVAAIRERFARAGRPMPESNLRQADVPEGARSIPNPNGTAPGVRAEHRGGVVYCLPGVPAEMRAMLEADVLPELAERAGAGACIVSRQVRVAGLAESAVAEHLGPLWASMRERGATMAFLAGGGEIRVRLTAKAPSPQEAASVLDGIEADVRKALGPAVFGGDEDSLESVVGDLLRAAGWSVACAESLTAGLAAGRIAGALGASDYFRGSIVAYASEAKAKLLGIPGSVLEKHGAVSEPCARAMAAGARKAFGADVGLALTGVAGPTRQDGAPVGTVHLAVDGPAGVVHREVHLPGPRNTVRALAATAGLNLVRLYMIGAARP